MDRKTLVGIVYVYIYAQLMYIVFIRKFQTLGVEQRHVAMCGCGSPRFILITLLCSLASAANFALLSLPFLFV